MLVGMDRLEVDAQERVGYISERESKRPRSVANPPLTDRRTWWATTA